ncbi:keywimysin-related RiPP [Streptomyces fenghuangensis]|nr:MULTISPECIES: keywimysin-related RiPP [Streptomyces]MBN3932580.1 lasso RiPP family leader peptide-containing protein [Streptomyces verrucosisporus]MCG3040563.1 keywimysin-related RiPP [Streptomyces sp. ICN903]
MKQKKTYVKPALFEQGGFRERTAGYFVGKYWEYFSRRFV